MPPLKKEQQQALILIGILAVLGGVLGYQFVWQPMARSSKTAATAATTRPHTAQSRSDLENLKRQLSRLPDLERVTAERRAAVGQLEGRLAKTATLDTLLADLSAMATASHVRIESVEPLETQGAAEGSQGVYAEMPIHILAKGGYHQLGAFINTLEQHARMLRLVHLEISGNADEPWRQSAAMIVSAFRLLEPKEVSR